MKMHQGHIKEAKSGRIRTIVEVREAFSRELPYEERNNSDNSNTACDSKANDGTCA